MDTNKTQKVYGLSYEEGAGLAGCKMAGWKLEFIRAPFAAQPLLLVVIIRFVRMSNYTKLENISQQPIV